jgi:hypothetical protein
MQDILQNIDFIGNNRHFWASRMHRCQLDYGIFRQFLRRRARVGNPHFADFYPKRSAFLPIDGWCQIFAHGRRPSSHYASVPKLEKACMTMGMHAWIKGILEIGSPHRLIPRPFPSYFAVGSLGIWVSYFRTSFGRLH